MAVVTGGSKELGEAMAACLAAEGSQVVIIARHLLLAQEVAAKLKTIGIPH